MVFSLAMVALVSLYTILGISLEERPAAVYVKIQQVGVYLIIIG
jgi:hypothetical protein